MRNVRGMTINFFAIKIVSKDDAVGAAKAKEEFDDAGYTIVYEDDADVAFIDTFRIGGKDASYSGARVIVGKREKKIRGNEA